VVEAEPCVEELNPLVLAPLCSQRRFGFNGKLPVWCRCRIWWDPYRGSSWLCSDIVVSLRRSCRDRRIFPKKKQFK
jgi:hypothetical protein